MDKLEKIENWDHFDEMVNSDITRAEEDLMKGYISILEVKEIIDENTSLERIQEFLRKEFNVNYSLGALEEYYVEEEITSMEREFLEG